MRYQFPVDPDCPKVQKWNEMVDDPIMRMSGCVGEITEDFEKQHRAECVQCFQFGLANVDAEL